MLGILGTDLRHTQEHLDLRLLKPGLGKLLSHAFGSNFIELIEAAKCRLNVIDAEALTNSLDNLAVVDQDVNGRDRQRHQSFCHHQGQIHFVVEGKLTQTNNINICLSKLAETPVLWAFTAPDLLDLITLKRKIELVGVLNHVTRKRNSQVKVKAHLAFL